MAPPDTETVTTLLTKGPHRVEVGRKQLTLAFAGLYIASTTILVKPSLVWETEKGYARYYVPTESLHAEIRGHLDEQDSPSKANGHDSSVEVSRLETVKGKGSDSEAIIEQLSVGSRSTTWVRFVQGPLKGLVRFERSEIGMSSNHYLRSFFHSGIYYANLLTVWHTQTPGSKMAPSSAESRTHTNASTLPLSRITSL